MKPTAEKTAPAAAQARRRKRRELLTGWLFLSPSIAGVALFFAVPFLVVIYYATVNNPVQHEFVWFKNFAAVLKNTAFLQAAKNTLLK